MPRAKGETTRQASDALDRARASALHHLIRSRGRLPLTASVMRDLGDQGFSRRDVERAIGDLVAADCVALANEGPVVVVTPREPTGER